MDQVCANCKHKGKSTDDYPCVQCVTEMRSSKWEGRLC